MSTDGSNIDGSFISYAQNHEDVVLARALRPDKQAGSWIDVGAGHPVWDSVTAAFAERGWWGINIEPLPGEFAELEQARPDDVNLRVAVGSTPGTGRLFEGPPENRGSSTMLPGLADRYSDAGQEFTPIGVTIRTLADIVAEHVSGPVDFLKVDVEGMEHDVLASADWSALRPRIVVVEATVPNTTEPSHEAWEPLLLAAGYRFALFDGLNRFYADEREPDLLADLQAPANVLDNFRPYAWVARLREADNRVADVCRVTRRAQDELATALEDVAVLRDDLGAAQSLAARAMGNVEQNKQLRQQIVNVEAALAAMYDTRTYRYLHPFRRVYSLSRRAVRLIERVS